MREDYLEKLEQMFPDGKEYCKCPRDWKPGYMIYVEKVNPPTCAKCHKEIRMEIPIESPKPQAEIGETIEYIDACDYADTDRIVSYLDYLVTQLRKILKLKYGIHRH